MASARCAHGLCTASRKPSIDAKYVRLMSWVYSASIYVCPHTHIVCVKAHTVGILNLLLLGKSWLHSQDKVGGL